MNRRSLLFALACVGITASVGCNAIVGNDGAVLSEDLADGGSGAPPNVAAERPGAQTQADSAASIGSATDSEAGNTNIDDDAGLMSTGDASLGTSKDAGAIGCSGGQVRCGSSCVDLQNDPIHCGDCATVCKAPPLCKDARCKHGN